MEENKERQVPESRPDDSDELQTLLIRKMESNDVNEKKDLERRIRELRERPENIKKTKDHTEMVIRSANEKE